MWKWRGIKKTWISQPLIHFVCLYTKELTWASRNKYGHFSYFLSKILSAISIGMSICRLGGIWESMKQFMMVLIFCVIIESSQWAWYISCRLGIKAVSFNSKKSSRTQHNLYQHDFSLYILQTLLTHFNFHLP